MTTKTIITSIILTMRRIADDPARPKTSSVLELSLVLIDPVAGNITMQIVDITLQL